MIQPTLRQLEYAVAVAEQLSFRRAAEACHVSQPGLSLQIQELERLLGTKLFERDRRRVLVTAEGVRVVERARTILAEMDTLVSEAQPTNRPLFGTLRLGVIPTVAPYLLPEALVGLRREYPDCRLLLREAQTVNLVEAVSSGKLDLALLAVDVDCGALHVLPLFDDAFWLVVSDQHRLASRKRVVDSDLAGEEVLLLEDGHCLRDHVLSVCHLAGASEWGDFRASSLPTLAEMVASGLGVSLLPEMSLSLELRPPRALKAIPFQRPGHHRRIGLAWRKGTPRQADFERLAALLQRASKRVRRKGGA